MNIVVIYIISLFATLGVNYAYKLNIINKLAKMGKKLKNNEPFPRLRPVDLVIGLNVIEALKRLVKTDYSQIEKIEETIDMDREELFSYSLSPDIFSAIGISENINMLSDEDKAKQEAIKIDEENEIVYYKKTHENENKYAIISVCGELLAPLKDDGLLEIVNEYYAFLERCLHAFIDKYYGGDEILLEEDLIDGKFDYISFKDKASKVYGNSVLKNLKK